MGLRRDSTIAVLEVKSSVHSHGAVAHQLSHLSSPCTSQSIYSLGGGAAAAVQCLQRVSE